MIKPENKKNYVRPLNTKDHENIMKITIKTWFYSAYLLPIKFYNIYDQILQK